MKYLFATLMVCIGSLSLYSQTEIEQIEKRNSATIGFLNGGGALLGADIEFLLSDKFGIQLGAGLVAFGAGLNYHFKPSIRSSFLSFQYWNQGVGESFAQNLIGPSFVFRGKKWFTFQIGLGVPLKRGPALREDFEQPPMMLTYTVGAYFPF